MEKPYGVPADFAEHFKLMTDMITVAFQADMTRVVTFLVTREGTSRAYREIGIPDGHHPLTHHRNDPAMMEKVAQINTYHMQQFASWIEKLKSIKEGDSTLLDNSMIVYGAGLSDGNRHTHEDLPTLIAGRGGNSIKTGPAHRLPQGDADVEPLPDDDGSHGCPGGAFRRLDRPARRPGSHVGFARANATACSSSC